jgi:hypothetical protein
MMAMGFWQLRWFKRLVIWGLVPLALIALFMSPLRGNVCLFEFRLSNERQQIEAALDYYIPRLSRKVDFEDEEQKTRIILPQFTTKENFKLRFPDCCSVTSVSKTVGAIWDWESWFVGKTVAFVNIVFEVPYMGDSAETLTVQHYDQIPISSCGAIESEVFTNPIGSVAKYPFGSPTQGMWE